LKMLKRTKSNFTFSLISLAVVVLSTYFVVGIIRLTTQLLPVTFEATLQPAGEIDFETASQSVNYTYLIRDIQAKNADMSIQNSDVDVYAVVTNNGLGFGHGFDPSTNEVGVQIGTGDTQSIATVAIPGKVLQPLSPLLRPMLLGVKT